MDSVFSLSVRGCTLCMNHIYDYLQLRELEYNCRNVQWIAGTQR